MSQWIDITPSSSRRTTSSRKKEDDDTNWVDITPGTYKPPEHPFTGPEEPSTLDRMKVSAGHLWDKTGGAALRGFEKASTTIPPLQWTPEMRRAIEENEKINPYSLAEVPGKIVRKGVEFLGSPIGIGTILSAGAVGPLAGIGAEGSGLRIAGKIGSDVITQAGKTMAAGAGISGAKDIFDASIDPHLNTTQKIAKGLEGLFNLELGKIGTGVYGHGGPPEGLKKVGDANVPPPPPGPPSPPISLPESPLSPQRSFDFGQPEPHLPFHGEPSMEVPVPFDERFQRTPIGITNRPGVPETRPQTPRPIEGPQVGPYGTGVGQPRLPLTDEFGQGELGLGNLVRPEANPSAIPYKPMGPTEVPAPKAEGETVAPDATQQPHVISARGMTKADIDMLRSQGYESGGQGPDNYAQMIRKAGPPTTAAMTTPASTPPPVASGATTTDVRAGQPVRVPKDALTSQLIERLKAQGFEKTGNDVNGDGLFTRVIKETGGWGDDAQLAQFFRDFFKREPSIEELADAAIPGDGRKGLFMKIMGTIHDTRNVDDLRRQVEILNEQKGIALNSGEPDAAYNLADLHREASDRLLALEGEGAPPGSLPGQRPQLPSDEPVRSFSDAVDDLHGQLESGQTPNFDIVDEVIDRIRGAKDIHEAMDMRSELGTFVDNIADDAQRQIWETLWQQADGRYYEFVRGMQDQPVPERNRPVAEVSNTLSSLIRHNMLNDEAEFTSLIDEIERGINNEVDHIVIQENLLRLHNLLEAPDVNELHQEVFRQLYDTARDKFNRSIGGTGITPDPIPPNVPPPQDLTQQPDYNLTGGPNFKASDFPTPKDAMEARQFEIERRYQNFGRARDKYRLPNGDIISVDATATKGIDSLDMGNGQVAKYVGPLEPGDTIDPATGNVVQLDPSGRPKTEPPAGAGELLSEPSGEIEDLRQQNGLEGITGPPTDEPIDLGQTPTLRDFIRDTSGEERNDELGRRIGIPEIKPPKASIERPEIEYEQARIQATTNPVFIERMTREYMGERRIAIRDKDWDRVHELDKQISQLADQRDMVYSQLYPDTPLSPIELEKKGQQQLPGMAATMDSGQPLTDMPPQTPVGTSEGKLPTQGQLPMSRRPKIGRIPGLTIDKIKEAEASLAPDRWDPGLDHEWGSRQLEGFLPQKGQPGLSVADVNGDTAIGVRDIGQIVYRNAQGTRPLVVARLEPLLDGSGKVGVKSFYSNKDAGAAQGRGVVAVIKKLVEIDALRVNGDYSSWTRDAINGLRDFIDDTGGWGDDSQLWENIKRRTGWGQGGKVQPPKLDPQGQPIKELNLLKELIAVPSAATTTGDLSASGRQALPFIFTPEFWKAQWPQLQAGWSKDAFDRINAKLEDLPLFRQRLDLTTGDLKPSLANELGMKLLKASDHIDEREAAIASRWLETGGNIPGFSRAYGATIGRYIRGSNRAYMTLLNHIRANRTQKLFDLSRDMSVKALETGEARPGFFKQKYTAQEALDLDPYTNKVLGKEIVDFVNTATGRGPLKMHILPYRKSEISLEGSADKLGYLLFAPRMIASRMRMLNPSTYIMASPFVRKQYLKAAISTAAAWMAINQMGKLAGAETNDDLDSADFGKMRFGDTRLDPAGGFQQFMVAYHRLYTGGYSSSSTGAWHRFGKGFQAQTQYDQGERLFSNKLNPVAKFAWDVLNASEYQPFHVYDRTAQLFVPLIIQDIYELAKEDPSLLPLVAPVAFGMGTQTYSKGESVGKFIQPEDDWLATGGGLQDLLPEGWQQER